jgi:DNA-binding Lrp family transcriptional regulator|tara:strand:+ start:8571 stop:9539 length:969 start_codon:yes stop_codon:yes gene_type:complete
MIDTKDKKLLLAISDDARGSLKKIARQARVSREVADYRIKKLEELDIIRGYQARVDLSLFIHGAYMLLLQLKKIDEKKEKEIINVLKKLNYVHWIGKTSGEYDLLITFSIKKISDLSTNLNRIFDSFGENIKHYSILTIVKEFKDTFAPLFTKESESKKSIIREFPIEKPKIDNIDKEIIRILGKKAKTTNREISKKLKLTEEAIRYRIKNLEKKNIIMSYRTIINVNKLSQFYFLMFNFSKLDSNNERKLDAYFRLHNNITFANRTIGEYSVIAVVFAKETKEFNEIIQDIRNKFSDILDKFNTMIIFETVEHNHVPEGFI